MAHGRPVDSFYAPGHGAPRRPAHRYCDYPACGNGVTWQGYVRAINTCVMLVSLCAAHVALIQGTAESLHTDLMVSLDEVKEAQYGPNTGG